MISRRNLVGGAVVAGATLHMPAVRAATSLKIGVIQPFSGMFALYGDELARGYSLALEDINAKGGVLGRTVEFVKGDAGTPQQGIAAVQLLAANQGVEAFIGTYLSLVSLVISDAAAQFDKLYWETNALAPAITERRLPNVIRSCPDVRGFAQTSITAVKDLIAPALGKRPSDLVVYVEHEDSEYGVAQIRYHKQFLAEAGIKNVTSSSHSFKAIDFTDAVLRAKAVQPDVWMIITYVPVINLLLRTARDQGFAPPVTTLVGTGDTAETLQAIGAADLEGVLVVGFPRAEQSEAYGPGAVAYLAAYRKKYNRDPIAPQCMSAFVGAQMMLSTIAAAGKPDPDAVRSAAAKLDLPVSSYATGYGAKYNDAFQNERAFPVVVQWQGGKLATVYPEQAKLPGTALTNLPRK